MLEENEAYIEFLNNFTQVEKPKMPYFELSAYTDNEYLNAINVINNEFDEIDEMYLTLEYLKGE